MFGKKFIELWLFSLVYVSSADTGGVEVTADSQQGEIQMVFSITFGNCHFVHHYVQSNMAQNGCMALKLVYNMAIKRESLHLCLQISSAPLFYSFSGPREWVTVVCVPSSLHCEELGDVDRDVRPLLVWVQVAQSGEAGTLRCVLSFPVGVDQPADLQVEDHLHWHPIGTASKMRVSSTHEKEKTSSLRSRWKILWQLKPLPQGHRSSHRGGGWVRMAMATCNVTNTESIIQKHSGCRSM